MIKYPNLDFKEITGITKNHFVSHNIGNLTIPISHKNATCQLKSCNSKVMNSKAEVLCTKVHERSIEDESWRMFILLKLKTKYFSLKCTLFLYLSRLVLDGDTFLSKTSIRVLHLYMQRTYMWRVTAKGTLSWLPRVSDLQKPIDNWFLRRVINSHNSGPCPSWTNPTHNRGCDCWINHLWTKESKVCHTIT